MKFSVIIPALNEADYIQATINAVKAQNIPRDNFEIIVVDNNSTDNTFDLAKVTGADKVVKELKHGTNMSRQHGFEVSCGKIVVFLDADSIPPPNWLSKIGDKLSKPDIAAVSGPFNYDFSNIQLILEHIYTHYLLPRIPTILKVIFHRPAGIIIGGNFATKRETIEKIGGLPRLSFWGDDATIAMLISRHVGRVVFDSNLVVASSQRRFIKQGFFSLVIRYIIAYLKAYFNNNY